MTGFIKDKGLISLITKQIQTKHNKHLKTPYTAPRMLSTALINPCCLSLFTIRRNNKTIRYTKTIDVTNAIIVTKKWEYADEIISAKDLEDSPDA